jgi:membrane-associated phospholipid phosphatase
MVLGVATSTVYLGYHHALDPILGLVWGAMCYPIAAKLIRTRGENALTTSEKNPRGVSSAA